MVGQWHQAMWSCHVVAACDGKPTINGRAVHKGQWILVLDDHESGLYYCEIWTPRRRKQLGFGFVRRPGESTGWRSLHPLAALAMEAE